MITLEVLMITLAITSEQHEWLRYFRVFRKIVDARIKPVVFVCNCLMRATH